MLSLHEINILQHLNLPIPFGINRPSDIEWDHPVLVFYAEHNIIPKNSREDEKSIQTIKHIVEQEIIFSWSLYETLIPYDLLNIG